ncbi:LysR family transcriptional regulator [Sorangium sp. So ce861]
MKLEGIATFVAVAEAGSISEAARRLRASKSVVSERLAELEKSAGASLIQRTTRKLSLTEDGAAFLERAVRIVREVEDATADLAARRGTLAGPPPAVGAGDLRAHAPRPGALPLPLAAPEDRADARSG